MPLWKQLSMIALITLVTACGGGGGGGGSDGGTSSAPSSGSGSSASGGSTAGTGGTTGGTGSGTSTGTGTSTGSKPVSQTVKLSWTSPSTRENGAALSISDLSGYHIYYYLDGATGSDSTVAINGGSTQSASITLTKAGTYYFAISAIDVSGLVSSLSNYVALTVN